MHHTCNCLKVCVEVKGLSLTQDDGEAYYSASQKLYDLARELCPRCSKAKPIDATLLLTGPYHISYWDRPRFNTPEGEALAVNMGQLIITNKLDSPKGW